MGPSSRPAFRPLKRGRMLRPVILTKGLQVSLSEVKHTDAGHCVILTKGWVSIPVRCSRATFNKRMGKYPCQMLNTPARSNVGLLTKE